jgi:carboxymethylenebutenolidase
VITVFQGARTTIAADGHEIAAYVARPEGDAPWPAVLVIHEAWGLNADIERIADRFSAAGYLAVAPDLIGGGLRCLVRAFRELARGEGRSVERARAALRWLAGHQQVDRRRVGVAGFCMGGGFALLLGADAEVRAIAPNYGRVPDDDHLERLCPVVASYGARDRAFHAQADRLERVLAAAEIEHDTKVYPGAGHSFMNQEAPWYVSLFGPIMAVGYHEESAEDAWHRILRFFAQHV